MDIFLRGFADELTKLGRALSPAEKDLRVQQQTTFKPPTPTPSSPTGPIQKTAPGPTDSFGPTKVPPPEKPMKLMNPYPSSQREGERSGFEFARPKSTAPIGTAQSLRPSNAAGPSPGALTAIPRQEMSSPPKQKERNPYRSSPGYTPKAVEKVEPKPAPKRRGTAPNVKDPGVAWEGDEGAARIKKEKASQKEFERKKMDASFQKDPSAQERVRFYQSGSHRRGGSTEPAEDPRFKTEKERSAWIRQQVYNRSRIDAARRAANAKYQRGKAYPE